MLPLRTEPICYNIGDGAHTCACSMATILAPLLVHNIFRLGSLWFSSQTFWACSAQRLSSSTLLPSLWRWSSWQLFRSGGLHGCRFIHFAAVDFLGVAFVAAVVLLFILILIQYCFQGFALVLPCCSRKRHHWVQVDSNRTMVPSGEAVAGPSPSTPFWGHNQNQP